MTEKQETKQFLRIWNTAIEGNLPIKKGLTKIKGIGINISAMICHSLKIPRSKKSGDLTDAEIKMIEELQKDPSKHLPRWALNRLSDFDTGKDELLISADLKLRKDFDIKRLRRIKCYVGNRHSAKLPVRGQRTKAHFRKGSAVGVKKPKKAGKK